MVPHRAASPSHSPSLGGRGAGAPGEHLGMLRGLRSLADGTCVWAPVFARCQRPITQTIRGAWVSGRWAPPGGEQERKLHSPTTKFKKAWAQPHMRKLLPDLSHCCQTPSVRRQTDGLPGRPFPLTKPASWTRKH